MNADDGQVIPLESPADEEAIRRARKRTLLGSLFIPIGLLGVWMVDSWIYFAMMAPVLVLWSLAAYRELKKPDKLLRESPFDIIFRVLEEDRRLTEGHDPELATGEESETRAERAIRLREELDRLEMRGSLFAKHGLKISQISSLVGVAGCSVFALVALFTNPLMSLPLLGMGAAFGGGGWLAGRHHGRRRRAMEILEAELETVLGRLSPPEDTPVALPGE